MTLVYRYEKAQMHRRAAHLRALRARGFAMRVFAAKNNGQAQEKAARQQ
jgi:hypothetical protein